MDLNEVKPRVADYSRIIVEEIVGVEVIGGYALDVLRMLILTDWQEPEGCVPSLLLKQLEGGILVAEEYLMILRGPPLINLQRFLRRIILIWLLIARLLLRDGCVHARFGAMSGSYLLVEVLALDVVVDDGYRC